MIKGSNHELWQREITLTFHDTTTGDGGEFFLWVSLLPFQIGVGFSLLDPLGWGIMPARQGGETYNYLCGFQVVNNYTGLRK